MAAPVAAVDMDGAGENPSYYNKGDRIERDQGGASKDYRRDSGGGQAVEWKRDGGGQAAEWRRDGGGHAVDY
ncbi:hypothetical protein FIBSPDRAFT_1036923 [Athelia psychrophila]|uniref:Uncharacterized protein n=1 Tax=Athelia psychrophila TaxID=1759441 RepID=A0A166V2W3_9AGAM|nr:hypothetical protein FIBSPDRAFT_1036923 [Fibularhizoctonia sp. CBS 109695]